MTELPIQRIISRSQHGDQEAFAALFDHYKNLVFKTAYLMLDDANEAEDALQEVFMRVYKSLPDYDPAKAAFSTWLYRVTLNHCLNRRRKQSPIARSWDEMPAESLSEPFTTDVADKELIWQAIKSLNDGQRAVVILRFYGELSYHEIGTVLDIPVGTVKSRLNLALKTLRAGSPDLSSEMEGR